MIKHSGLFHLKDNKGAFRPTSLSHPMTVHDRLEIIRKLPDVNCAINNVSEHIDRARAKERGASSTRSEQPGASIASLAAGSNPACLETLTD